MSTHIGPFPKKMFTNHLLPQITDIQTLLAFRRASHDCKNLVDNELLTITLYLAITISRKASIPKGFHALPFWGECAHASNEPVQAMHAYSPEQFEQLPPLGKLVITNLSQPRLQPVFVTSKAACEQPSDPTLKTIGCYQIRHQIKSEALTNRKCQNFMFYAAVKSQAKDIVGFIDTSGKFTSNPHYCP